MLLGKILYAIVVIVHFMLIQLFDLSFETGKKAFNLIGRGQRSLLPIHISYRINNRSETHVK